MNVSTLPAGRACDAERRLAAEAFDYIYRAASSAEPLTPLLITIAETARDAAAHLATPSADTEPPHARTAGLFE